MEAALGRVQGYFRGTRDTSHPEAGLLTHFLARRFPDELGFRPRAFPPPSTLGPHRLVLQRVIDPAHPLTLDDILSSDNPINQMVAAAQHCDLIPLPPSYPLTLRQGNELGGLFVTHAVIATMWAEENGCLRRRDLPPDIVGGQRAGLASIIENGTLRESDLWIEAIALAHYVGDPSMVPPTAMDALLSAQESDGGWSGYAQDGAPSNDHSSALALWVLLERSFPGRTTPWSSIWR